MKLLSVEGSNVGLLKGNFNFNFNGSLTAITGPIGVGKSTLLMMVKSSLTNSVPGSAASWVSWGADKGEPSYFKATWRIEDRVVEVARPMVDSSSFKALDIPRIRVTDLEDNVLFEAFTSSGAGEILQTVLPVTSKVVDTHLVVDQDSISHPTNATPAKFQETLHTLTKVNEIEKIRAKLRESLSSYTVPEVSELMDTVNRDLTELESQLAQKLKEKKEINAKLLEIDPELISNGIIEEEQLKLAQDQRDKLRVDVENTLGSIGCLDKEKGVLTSQLEQVNITVVANKDQAEVDEKYVAAYQHLKNVWDRQQTILFEISTFEKGLKALSHPEEPVGGKPDSSLLNPLREQRVKLETDISITSAKLGVCELGVCPTCHQTTEGLDAASLRGRQTELNSTLKELTDMLNLASLQTERYQQYTETLQKFEVEKSKLEAEISSRQSSVDHGLNPVSEEEFKVATGRINSYKVAVASSVKIASDIAALDSRCGVYRLNLDKFNKDIVDLAAGDKPFDPVRYKSLVEVQNSYQEYKTQLYSVNEAIKDKQIQVDKIRDRKSAVEGRAAQAEPILRYRGTLEKAIEVLKKDNLPRLLSTQYLGEINEKLQLYLSMIDAQFVAWIDDELNFMVKKSDGLVHKANRLSGGQKQQASIAYLLSVNDVFASSLGVLILDEPTGSMQEENAKDVAEAFGKLLQIGKAMNRQFIVVTHSKSLAAYSDQAIEMPIT